ncbi:MAG: OmpH family outer membrane protein [Saprospiraceae bacterium]|nr:OmpH family outer membrane protein [Saprospiraceae bacterium]
MNNLTKLTIISMISLGLFACQQKKTQDTTATPTPTTDTKTVSNEKGKIVYVNIDSLMEKYNFYQDSKNNLEGQIKNMQKEVEERATSIQKEYVGYQQKGDNMTPVEMQAAQKSLAAKEQSLNAYKAKIEESIMKQQQQLDKILKDKINVYLAKKAEDHGYDYILSYTSAGIGMLYGNKNLDITNEVITELNDLYKSEKK